MVLYKRKVCVVIICYWTITTIDVFAENLQLTWANVSSRIISSTLNIKNSAHNVPEHDMPKIPSDNDDDNNNNNNNNNSNNVLDIIRKLSDSPLGKELIKFYHEKMKDEPYNTDTLNKIPNSPDSTKFALPNIGTDIIDPLIKQFVYSHTEFIVYNKENSTGQTYSLNKLTDAKIDNKKSTKMLIHGWNNDRTSDMPKTLKTAYLANDDFNVIVVDWGVLSKIPLYPLPANGTDLVGAYVADFVLNLYCDSVDKTFNIHMIGYSLGAHVAGFAGRRIKNAGYLVHRITALDPAKPFMSDGLQKDDAQFVDVIHTTSGLLGKAEALGEVDFYPNGGTVPQPGCIAFFKEPISCSHSKSWEYFAESIKNPNQYLATVCDYDGLNKDNNETAHMGEGVSEDSRGSFCLDT